MTMPEFWCEVNDDGSLTLFYFSSRGNYMAPLAAGIVKRVAKHHFELDIFMECVTRQGIDGSRFTSWIVRTESPGDLYKLYSKTKEGALAENQHLHFPTPMKCPMTGIEVVDPASSLHGDTTAQSPHQNTYNSAGSPPAVATTAGGGGSTTAGTLTNTSLNVGGGSGIGLMGGSATVGSGCPSHQKVQASRRRPSAVEMVPQIDTLTRTESSGALSIQSTTNPGSLCSNDIVGVEPGGLSAEMTRKLFPYHVCFDSDFFICQVGPEIPKILGTSEAVLYGYEIDEVFEFVKPKQAKWTKSWLRKLEDQQEFVLESTLTSSPEEIAFKGTLVTIRDGNTTTPRMQQEEKSSYNRDEQYMLVLCPDAKNLDELRNMKLTLSDLPAHGAYRDAVFLREHLSRQMNNALKMEKLSKTLQTEKELLESLLPVHAAEGLRTGKGVEPMLHNNVTMFFSDIVGFTNICKTISPWHVINMLNQLYGIMDHLAKKFHLFKVETIGDAYVCCSGLPESDTNHATNVANFAVAIAKHCSMVLSPLDGSPLKLRIGVHTGACASGIVGVTNPRYCVFGDTVNTTARHESTGEPGRVHCSLTTMIELMQRAPEDFNLISRGLVDMKGKGAQPTYWLEANDTNNKQTGKKGLKQIGEEITRLFAAELCRMDKDDGMDMSARHVVASPKRNEGKPKAARGLLIKSQSKRRLLHVPADLDDEDLTVSTTSSASSQGEETSGYNLSQEYSISAESSGTPSKSALDRLIRANQQRPRASRDRHDADLLRAIEHVEAVMTRMG